MSKKKKDPEDPNVVLASWSRARAHQMCSLMRYFEGNESIERNTIPFKMLAGRVFEEAFYHAERLEADLLSKGNPPDFVSKQVHERTSGFISAETVRQLETTMDVTYPKRAGDVSNVIKKAHLATVEFVERRREVIPDFIPDSQQKEVVHESANPNHTGGIAPAVRTRGYIDGLVLDDQSRVWVLELKFAPEMSASDLMTSQAQGQMYCHMLNLSGVKAAGVLYAGADWHPNKKGHETTIWRREADYSPRIGEAALKRVQQASIMQHVAEKHACLPPNYGFMCSGCGYRNACASHTGVQPPGGN